MSRKRRGIGRVTQATVAELAGVSSMTVSRYFNQPERVNEAHRARIAAAVAQTGYVPNLAAGGLASARGRIVAMVVPNISGPIFAPTLQAFSAALEAEGYQVLLASSYFDEQKEEHAVRAFLGWAPAALVLTSRFHSAATESMLAAAQVPLVETWDYCPERTPVQVGFSHRAVGEQGAAYLFERGYRRATFVLNSATGDHSALERCEGFCLAFEALGGQASRYVPSVELAPFEAGKAALLALMQAPSPPEALFFANDNLAAGGLLAAARAGISVPGQCAILGFGDYPFAQMLLPSLSSIRPPAQAIGEQAARWVLEGIAGQASGQPARLECEVVGRESA